MKKNRAWLRSAVSILLIVLMIISQCGAVFAADETKKIYVSVGDSMTNGYGLEETKDENGNYIITKDIHPTLLGQSYGYDVSGHQGYLEISTKAYPWHLSQHYGWDLIQLATSASRAEDVHYILEYDYVNDVPGEYKGDNWTQTDLAQNPYRWGSHSEKRQEIYGVKDAYGVKNAARVWQESISKADVISLSLGNGNLGVFLSGMITASLGIFGIPEIYSWVEFEDAIAPLDADIQDMLRKMYDTLYAELIKYLPEEQAESLFRCVSYALASYIVNYMGAIDRVVELNPDAEIIIMGLFNTLDEALFVLDDENHTVDLGDILSLILEPLNYFMAAYPARMQDKGNFPEAKFIYAECDSFESVSQTVTQIVPKENETIRIRYINNIQSAIFTMLEQVIPLNRYLTIDNVNEYEDAASRFEEDPTVLAKLISKNPITAKSVAIYLALEKAMLTSAGEPMTLDSVSGLTDVGPELFKDFLDEYDRLTADLLTKEKTTIGELSAKLSDIAGSKDPSLFAQEVYAIYNTPQILTSTLLNKDIDGGIVFGLLNMYTRLKLADGHPSTKGHLQITEAIIKAYDENYTVKEFVTDLQNALLKLAKLLQRYAPEISEDIADWAENEGYKEDYINATTGEVVYEDEIYYLSLGDSITTGTKNYAGLLAEEPGLTDTQFRDLGNGNLRCEDLRYILDEEYVPDEYSKEIENIDSLRKEYAEEIKKADLITLGTGNITPFAAKQLYNSFFGKDTYEMDWAKYVGKENVKYVEMAMEEVKKVFENSGLGNMMGMDIAMLLTLFVESYAYAFTGFSLNYAEVANAIHRINPDAELVLVGSYNPFKELVITSLDEPMSVGQYVDYLIRLTDIQFTAYAMMTDNTTFVGLENINAVTNVTNELELLNCFFEDEGKCKGLSPDSDSHEYIKDAILGSVRFTKIETPVPDPEEGIPGDVNKDGVINALDATQILRYCNSKSSVFSDLSGDELNSRKTIADVNSDGLVNALDATQILRYCNSKPSVLNK